MQHSGSGSQIVEFPRETEGLPEARTTELVELADGDEFELEIVPVRKRIDDATVRMLAYNGSVPGPTLKVAQGSTITVHVTNHGDLEATVHWHGLRLDNRYDGTHDTQAPIPVGDTFTYQVNVPDAGAFWYHPHIREDYGQAMGRFGNVMLVAGEADLQLVAKRGEVVRFYFTNTANTRVFNVALPGAQMKLVGADAGRYEREEPVEEVLLAPSERAIVDVLFPEA